MKKFFFISIILLTFLNNQVFAKWGEGELKLSKSIMENVMMYMYGAGSPKYERDKNQKNKPDIMAISEDGKSSYYFYCPYPMCEDPDQFKTKKLCEKRSNGSPCWTFAIKRKIVWRNGNKKLNVKSKWLDDPIKVAQALKDSGFYDGDIYKLAGIDTKTGQIDQDQNIVGKIDNYDYPSLIASLTLSHKDGWKEYVEGGNEKYKVWVMAKRKDKDMAWSFEANNSSWNDVTKKAFNRCNQYINNNPKSFPDKAICILYYKGTKPTSDDEKIKTARVYYGETKANEFFKEYPYVLNEMKSLDDQMKKKISKNIVSELKELKKLFDEGILTQEEFEKAKKKILN